MAPYLWECQTEQIPLSSQPGNEMQKPSERPPACGEERPLGQPSRRGRHPCLTLLLLLMRMMDT